MSDKTYPYDPDLPLVLENVRTGSMMGRAVSREIALAFSAGMAVEVIDTTPAPRVPEDARYITWFNENGYLWVSEKSGGGWFAGNEFYDTPEDLPGVTPDTVFTVLEERQS